MLKAQRENSTREIGRTDDFKSITVDVPANKVMIVIILLQRNETRSDSMGYKAWVSTHTVIWHKENLQ
jgi:hypothetical protein